jgi:NADH-quinone oxidoreductase subunit M
MNTRNRRDFRAIVVFILVSLALCASSPATLLAHAGEPGSSVAAEPPAEPSPELSPEPSREPSWATGPPPAPHLVLSARGLAFDFPGQVRTVTLRNDGGAPLRLGALRTLTTGKATGNDFVVEGRGRRTLGPGESIAVNVSYRPQRSLGRRQSFGALIIASDDPRLPLSPTAARFTSPQGPDRIAGVALRAGSDFGLLSWLIFAPLFGIPIVLLWPRGRESALRVIALGTTVVPLALAALLSVRFDPGFGVGHGNFGFQFVEHVVWLRAFNVEYYVGVDGLSVGLIVLTALVSVLAVLASWSMSASRQLRGYFALLFLLETGMLGVFVALDLFMFYVFWELVLLPMYFLIGLWGGPRKEYAAIKFFIYTLVGAVLILLAILALYYTSQPTYLIDGTPADHTLDMAKLAHDNDFGSSPALMGLRFANVVWVLLFIGFAIKIPVVPLHTWLPDAHVEAPTAVSLILAGVLLKMGTYGLLRVSWAILPEATRWGAPAVAVLGAVAVIYGGFCALGQKDLKALVAYSSIGHMGFCLLGMAALTPLGIEGAVFQMISHGVVSAMLFLLVGVLYDRTGERGIDAFGGVATVMPRYAAFFGLGFMASLGLPGLSGFIGELMVLLGSFGPYRVPTVVAALGLVISAAYNLWAIRQVQFGELPERWRDVLGGRDLDRREWASLLPLAFLTIVLGFYPAPVLGAVATGVADLLQVMGISVVGLGGGF